jgi:hypothetical protein
MPIVEKPSPDSDLTQGYLLQGVPLYSVLAVTGVAEKIQNQQCFCCLVLSRPCVAQHKESVVVALVDRYRDPVPKEASDSFSNAHDFLEAIRDARRTPDKFYLGQLPDIGPGRFRAHLDSLHTIKLPRSEDLKAFLRERRFARLAWEFLRDLHVRIFSSFASLGFNDYDWYSTEDLKWIVGLGSKELAALEADVLRFEAEGEKPAAIKNLRERIKKIKDELEPYSRSMDARSRVR